MDGLRDQTLDGAAAGAEPRLWAAFAVADGSIALGRAWLALQCRLLDGVRRGMLVAAPAGGSFQPVALWPQGASRPVHLQPLAEQAVRAGEPVVHRPPHEDGAETIRLAYPYLAEGEGVVGAVVLEIEACDEAALAMLLRRLHWGLGWLEAQAMRERIGRERGRAGDLAAALDLVALANEHDRVEAMAMAVANELAARTGASRVAIGLNGPRGAQLVAVSSTAWFKRRARLARALAAAMEEAMDQHATVRLPQPPDEPARIQVAHEALREAWAAEGSIITVPMPAAAGPEGAILALLPADRADPAVRLIEAVAALLGPGLAARRRARRLLSGRLVDGAADALGALAGRQHLAWKLAGAGLALACAAALLVPMGFRVSARSVLEGEVQRAVPAPFDGFIATAPAHAGDRVTAGTVLATLDDKDLQLDRVRWQSERDRLALKLREAMAKHDPAEAGQIEAQLRQTAAQAALTAEKLQRARITAPIDGIVVSGDLSQQLGAPVETGRLLFEVAPLDRYRVIVHLDERDLRLVRPGDSGQVLLHGLSGAPLPFTVTRIAAVAQPDGGHNTFRVEAALRGAPPNLRPGMEGVGKIEVGRRSIAYVWTRGLVDWARATLWAWTP